MTADDHDLREELAALRSRLSDTEQTLRAIRNGEVDALVVGDASGHDRVFTLTGSDQVYRSFVENMSDGAATVSEAGIVLYANAALARMVGSTWEAVVGQPVVDLVSPASRAQVRGLVGLTHPSGSVEAELAPRQGDATPLPVLIGASTLTDDVDPVTCLTFTDLSSERAAEARLAHLARHDALTGTANRALLMERVERALAEADGRVTALLFCDVDGFKNVNDAYGHEAGDRILQAVASRLVGAVRPGDTVARLGGDEFVVLCESVTAVTEVVDLGHRIRDAVAAPFTTLAEEITVTVSIGVAVGEPDSDPDGLLRDADEAMYKAKRRGPNTVELFDEELRRTAAARVRLVTDLRRAVRSREFSLVYQPVVDLATERIVGAEALLRWEHPERGPVPPAEFVPFAERSGLIVPLGARVLREACRVGAAWAEAARPGEDVTMSVNVSGRQLAPGVRFVETVAEALRTTGLPPSSLVLEVTESALMEDAEAARRVVGRLKDLGVGIAIDDFGTGYSSLIYLRSFPADLLKVDRSFVAGLGVDPDDTSIVRSVVDLAAAFGIRAVAEGIETACQLDALRTLGCDLGQGFLWSEGATAEAIGPVLADAPRSRRVTA